MAIIWLTYSLALHLAQNQEQIHQAPQDRKLLGDPKDREHDDDAEEVLADDNFKLRDGVLLLLLLDGLINVLH